MSKGSLKFEDGKIVAGFDSNEDGQASAGLELKVSEAVEEGLAAMKKGEKKVVELEAKKVSLEFEEGKVKVSVDTDGDGEAMLSAFVDLQESFEEISQGIFKKD